VTAASESSAADRDRVIEEIRRELQVRRRPRTIEELSAQLEPLSVGLTQRVPVLFRGTRMFRTRKMQSKPSYIHEIGAPPADVTPIGRLNAIRQSVLYLADSPDTAFSESRAISGEFCLSEWSVTAEKLAAANGGLSADTLALRFPKEVHEGEGVPPLPGADDEKALGLFREIYTLDVGQDGLLYAWSIACGRVNGFSHACDRVAVEMPDGMTKWEGRCPYGAITYPSVRMEKPSLNYALNDHGRRHVEIRNLQWVRRLGDGSYTSLDFADSWGSEGRIAWKGRPARFKLKPGEAAKVTKVTETSWRYETPDGSIPWFV